MGHMYIQCGEDFVDVETEHNATVHVHQGPDGIIIDVWAKGYNNEPVFTVGLDFEALDPNGIHEPA